MRTPPPNLAIVLQSAAARSGVPYTLLAAIAYIESAYKVDAIGPKLKDGTNARGLFQLTDGVVEGYNVSDPMDPSAAADGASRYLFFLIQRYGYDWTKVLAAYHMGPTALEQLQKAGKPLPSAVEDYVENVKAARRWLQRRIWDDAHAPPSAADKPGQQRLDLSPSAMQRLNDAIEALDKANPGWDDARTLVDTWRDWYSAERGNRPDALMVSEPAHVAFWASYMQRYDRAPLTPSDVPPPEYIAPNLWTRFLGTAQRILDAAREAKNAAADIVRKAPIVINVDDPQRRPVAIPVLPLLAALALYFITHRKEARP